MRVKEVDPYKVNADEMNERKENLNLSELEKSVEEQGIIQPPIVRERDGDHEVDYTVVVGQRRTLAAQGAGLDTIPVVVMEWEDGEALEASITENLDAFQQDVSKRDRAMAVQRLKELKGWTNVDVADHLGVSEMAVRRWLEPLKDEWEGTLIQPDVDGNKTDIDVGELDVEEIPSNTIKSIREITGGGKEGEELLKKIQEHGLNHGDAEEFAKKVKRGRDVEDAFAKTIEEKHNTGDIKVNANVTFSGEYAGALTDYAQDRGMTENEVVREAIQSYLDTEGYL